MTHSTSRMSPRGWALVSLAGGALLASPFVRVPKSHPQPSDSTVAKSFVASEAPWDSTANAPSRWQSGVASAENAQQLLAASAWDVRTVTGQLPSTAVPSPRQLPDWVQTPSQLDRLIARPEQETSHQEAMNRAEAVLKDKPREFRAWRSPATDERQADRPSITWKTPQALPGYRPLAAHTPPSSPWTTEAGVEPTPGTGHALASRQWPDEAMMSEVQQLMSPAPHHGERRDGNRINRLTAGSADGTAQAGFRSSPWPASRSRPEPLPAPKSTDDRSRFVYQPGMAAVDTK